MQTLYVRTGSEYREATRPEVAEVAGQYVIDRVNAEQPKLAQPSEAVQFLKNVFAGRDAESFVAVFTDSRLRVIECVEMFRGSLTSSSVHPREVVKAALWRSAASVLFAHNHPSGDPQPSEADIAITRRLQQALGLIDVRVLDHFVIGGTGEWLSMNETGLM